jgi:hypothetical protein
MQTPLDGRPVDDSSGAKSKGCFNCGEAGHMLRDCPEPYDRDRVAIARSSHGGGSRGAATRYHVDLNAGRFASFAPGHLSATLREALGIGLTDAPGYIDRMRVLGYPPGWKALGTAALQVHRGHDGESYIIGQAADAPADPEIKYPGFNCALVCARAAFVYLR